MSKPTRLTAEAYYAKYLEGGNAKLSRLWRWLRMIKVENPENLPDWVFHRGVRPTLRGQR